MVLVNGGATCTVRKEIPVDSSLKATKKNIGYGPLKNSDERSRAILALLFRFPATFSKGLCPRVIKSRDCWVKS